MATTTIPHRGVGDHSFSTYAKFSEKLTFLAPDSHVSFSENLAYVLNKWFLVN